MHLDRRLLLLALGGSALAIPSARAEKKAPPAYTGNKLGLAMVGLGRYATDQVGVGLEQSDYWQVRGIVTGSPHKIPAWQKKWQIADKNVFSYANFDEIAKARDIDAVYICLPNSMHAEFAIRAAQAGKHVIVEKPMATSVSEAQQMIAACQKAGVKLAVGYRLHFNQMHQQIMAFARNRTFGKVQTINAMFSINVGEPGQWRLKKALSGGGCLMDVGIYCVQAARYATGEEPIAVTAQFGPVTDPAKFNEVEEGMTWQMKFPSGAYMTGLTGYKNYLDQLYIGAEQKSYKLEPAFSYGPLYGEVRQSQERSLQFPHQHHQRMQMEGLGALILQPGPMPDHISGVEGLKDMRIVTALYEAANSGKQVLLNAAS